MFLLLFSACSVFQPIDGTWLVQFNPNSTATGDCAGDDSGDDGTYTGTQNMWVDAYTLSGNEIVIILGGDALIGTLTGTDVQAEYSYGYKQGNNSSTQTETLEATLEGGVMDGTYTSSSSDKSGSSEYHCAMQVEFTANRAVSSPDSYSTH